MLLLLLLLVVVSPKPLQNRNLAAGSGTHTDGPGGRVLMGEDGGPDADDEDDEDGNETGWKPAYATKEDPLSRTFVTDLKRVAGSETGTHDRGIGFVHRPLDGPSRCTIPERVSPEES